MSDYNDWDYNYYISDDAPENRKHLIMMTKLVESGTKNKVQSNLSMSFIGTSKENCEAKVTEFWKEKWDRQNKRRAKSLQASQRMKTRWMKKHAAD